MALATVVAAALRLPFLATQSLWFDETYTARVVDTGSLATLWDRIGATESTPPLFYLLTWAWTQAIGNEGEAALRTVSALALVASVPVGYGALRRFVGERPALATAALVACSPLLTWYALDARAYGLLVLTGLLSVWACGAVLEQASVRRLAWWALAAAAAIWTHWFAGFLVLGEVVAVLWLAPAARRGVVLATAGVALALVPLAGLLREQTGDERAGFIADAGMLDRIEQLVRQFAAGPNVPRTWLEGALLAVALGGLAVGAALALHRTFSTSSPQASWEALPSPGVDRTLARALLTIAGVALLLPLALAALGIYDRFNVRNVLFAWPLAAALAAPALLRLRAVPLAAVLALGAATAIWVHTDWRYGNTDWRGAIERIEAIDPARPVVVVTPLGQPVAAHYLGRAPSATPVEADRAWLVVEPARAPGRRELAPVAAPPIPGFVVVGERLHRGFRLVELSSARPAPLGPALAPVFE